MLFLTSILIYLLYAVIIVVLVRVAFSWVSPYPTNAVSRFAWRLSEPVLGPVRRRLPPAGPA